MTKERRHHLSFRPFRGGNPLVSADLHTNERVLDRRYGGGVAVVLTNFRILAFRALTDAWREEKLLKDPFAQRPGV